MQLFPPQRYNIAVGLKTFFIFVRVLIAVSIKISVLKIDAMLFVI